MANLWTVWCYEGYHSVKMLVLYYIYFTVLEWKQIFINDKGMLFSNELTQSIGDCESVKAVNGKDGISCVKLVAYNLKQ